MNKQILLWSITSALAGFLFGFDTVVISGAEQTIQAIWHLTATAHGVAIASALYGTVVGAMSGGYLADRLGRRATLVLIGILYFVGAGWSALSNDVYGFAIARVLGGIGIGISTVAAPLYITEIAPPQYRGRLTGMFQFNIVFGILVAYLSNALLVRTGTHAWRWMLGIATIPSLIYTAMAFCLPETPRWLLTRRNDAESARRILSLIEPTASPAKIQSEVEKIRTGTPAHPGSSAFWRWELRKPIALAILIAAFNQLSGINAILYFAPRIFELAGLGADAALLQSVGIGVTNLLFTLLGLWLIDRKGRRTLLYIGSYGYVASLTLVAWSFHARHFSLVPAAIFAFIAAHAVGQGAVIWVFISEIFPNRQRAEGQALGCSVHWLFAAAITTFFPVFVVSFSPTSVFLFFAFMMILQLLWVKLMVVETKGVSLEQIQTHLN